MLNGREVYPLITCGARKYPLRYYPPRRGLPLLNFGKTDARYEYYMARQRNSNSFGHCRPALFYDISQLAHDHTGFFHLLWDPLFSLHGLDI